MQNSKAITVFLLNILGRTLSINYAGGRDEVFTHKTVLIPAVNLFKTDFTSRISVLHLHAGTGRYGRRGGNGVLHLRKNKEKQLQYNL